MPEVSDEYFAGLIDGEGYIGITPVKSGKSKHLTIVVVVAMTDKSSILRLRRSFGGSFASTERGGNTKTAYSWRVYAKKAEECLRRLSPFLLVKKKQVEVCLLFRDHMKNGGIMSRGMGRDRHPEKDKKILEFRSNLRGQIQKLNKRGIL